jgi:hypothetical protein
MESKIINIIIKEVEQDGERYFLARSLELPWLIVETNTINEMLDTVRDVADDLIESNNQYKDELWLDREPIQRAEYQLILHPFTHRQHLLVHT